MIKTGCVNPEILAELSHCMHGDKVLVTTGNFRSNRYGRAKIVYVGISIGLPNTTDVVKALKDTVNFEKIEFMDVGQVTPTYIEIMDLLPEVPVEYHERQKYYDVTKSDDVALVIVTADTRYASNVLLTIYL